MLLELSEEAQGVSRFREWVKASGLEVREIRLCQEFQVGAVEVRAVGLHKPTLLLSVMALRTMDWRACDAVLAQTLGAAHRRLSLRTTVGLAALLGIAGIYLVFLATGIGYQSYLVSLLVIFLVLVRVVLRRFLYAAIRKQSLEADRFGVYLTGDPVAFMVALHTLVFLNGSQMAFRPHLMLPTGQERVEALDVLVRQAWPRAPYAGELVPSIVPVLFGVHLLTQPFVKSVQRLPHPVPVHPYKA